jgi:methionyl-tRNA synthetase
MTKNMKRAMESALDLARRGNAYVDDEKPWALAKTDEARLSIVLGNLTHLLRALGKMLHPFMPEASEAWLAHVKGEKVELGEPLFPHLEPKE